MKKKFRIIALVARNHGLEVLEKLIPMNNFEIIAIFTHKLNPKVYDPFQKIRQDYKLYYKISEENNIPLFTIDKKEEKYILNKYVEKNNFDFLVSVSWRYLISDQVFQSAKIGSFNIHRGDLPKYAGVEPIRRAIENDEKEIFVCSHIITKEIDQGRILSKYSHPIKKDKKTKEEKILQLKDDITPLFSKLAIDSLDILLKEHYE